LRGLRAGKDYWKKRNHLHANSGAVGKGRIREGRAVARGDISAQECRFQRGEKIEKEIHKNGEHSVKTNSWDGKLNQWGGEKGGFQEPGVEAHCQWAGRVKRGGKRQRSKSGARLRGGRKIQQESENSVMGRQKGKGKDAHGRSKNEDPKSDRRAG